MSRPTHNITAPPEHGFGQHRDRKIRILLQYPDITLKGKNQKDFQNALYINIKRHLEQKGFPWHIGASHGRASIIVPDQEQAAASQAASILRRMPGVYSLAVATWLHPGDYLSGDGSMIWEPIEAVIIDLARQHYREGAAFAVQVKRTDKTLPVTSGEIGTRLGAVIRQETGWNRVRLKDPDQAFCIDAHPDGLYIYPEKHKGVGGLPVGTGGRVLALLSGGIDSPVAAFMLAKRGCHVDFFHLSAGHMRRPEIAGSVIGRLAAHLSQYTQSSRLYVAPYTYFDLALGGLNSGYELVLFRRFLMRAAEKLAGQIHARALVNGDSLGQVASQTLDNLVSSSQVVSMPVFRPLIGFNKDEIISTARRIGSYDIAIEPYKDCCALIARHPKTRSSHDKLAQLEAEQFPAYAELLERTFADMVRLDFRYGEILDE